MEILHICICYNIFTDSITFELPIIAICKPMDFHVNLLFLEELSWCVIIIFANNNLELIMPNPLILLLYQCRCIELLHAQSKEQEKLLNIFDTLLI